jgi:large-conductance mechanosensitive channel
VFLFIVKPYNVLQARFVKPEDEADAGPSEIELLTEIRDSLRSRPI